MKLFLTSAGISTPGLEKFFLSHSELNPALSKAVMLYYSQNADEQHYIDGSIYELENLGFNVEFYNLKEEVPENKVREADLIYICGGNTFIYLQRLKELGLDKVIVEKVKSGTPYVGVSAGSIVAGPSIEIAGWGSEGDPNEINLTDFDAFHLTETALWPHYRDELKNEVDSFRGKVNYEVVALTNEQMLYVVPSGQAIIE